MKLPFFRNHPTPPPREYIFALEIGEEAVKSAIWTVANDKTQVLSFGGSYPYQPDSTSSLITSCDRTLSEATQRLDQTGKTPDPSKLILGLPVSWVNDDKINSDHLRKLRELTQKLSLTAIGFVVTPQALVKYMHFTEGVPPSAIFIGFSQNQLEVTLVSLGKIESTQTVKISGHITSDIVEGLSRMGHVDMFPSRILIYDSGSDLEDTKQELLSFPWQAPQHRLTFLHFPKVEVLPADFSVKAISLAGGSEVAVALGLISKPSAAASPIPVSAPPPQDLGFVEGDISENPLPPVSQTVQSTVPELESIPEPVSPRPRPHLNLALPHFSLPPLPQFRFSLPLLFFFILIVILSLAAAYWYLPKATVTLTLTPRSLEHQFEIIADSTTTTVDPAAGVLPAALAQVTVSGHQTKATTGTKLVGDKATGEITVINGTPSGRSFPAGTVLTSSSGLKFTFNTSVSIEAATGSADPNSYQPGKANVKITAADIGSDGNISAGSQFKIGTFSSLDYVAKNEAAFVGGSSRQVAAVSKDDLASLRTQTTTALIIQAKDQLKSQVAADQQIILESLKTTTVSEKFDYAVGDTADNLNLDLNVSASALEFSSPDLDSLVTHQISSQIPEGYTISGSPGHIFTLKSLKDKQATLNVQVSAALIPNLDTDEIAKNILGKSLPAAKTTIESIPGIARIDFKFYPRLPAQFITLPHQLRNIGIVIQTVGN